MCYNNDTKIKREEIIKMTKTQIIEAMAAKSELSKAACEKAYKAAFETIAEALAAGDKVQVAGFGTFEVRARGERQGRNPRTGETIVIAASKNVGFAAGKALKESLN